MVPHGRAGVAPRSAAISLGSAPCPLDLFQVDGALPSCGEGEEDRVGGSVDACEACPDGEVPNGAGEACEACPDGQVPNGAGDGFLHLRPRKVPTPSWCPRAVCPGTVHHSTELCVTCVMDVFITIVYPLHTETILVACASNLFLKIQWFVNCSAAT